jgi:Zn-dependent alcohol dehydrogenase
MRSIDLPILGSGFGSAPPDKILATIPQLFSMAAAGRLKVVVEPVPLAQVEAAWSRVEKGRRIAFTVPDLRNSLNFRV